MAAIVREPQVFLMDEPLSNLDAKLRVQARTEPADLQARLDVTTVSIGSQLVPISDDVKQDLNGREGDLVVGFRPEHLKIAAEGVPVSCLPPPAAIDETSLPLNVCRRRGDRAIGDQNKRS